MTTGHRIKVKHYRLDKAGRLVRTNYHKDVSARLRERGSKKVRVVKPNNAMSTGRRQRKET